MPSEARACAHLVLRRVFEQGAYADRAFHAAAGSLSQRDRALSMRIAYGAIQRTGTLDHVLARLAGRPTQKLDGAVLTALRTGLYELIYMSGPAPHAIVNDAVELVKRSGSRGEKLVNATLRRAVRERASLLDGVHDRDPESAAIAHSHPPWLASMWWTQLGPERARALLAADNEPAETTVRVNTLLAEPATVVPLLPSDGQLASLLGVELPEALVLDAPFDLVGSQLWRDGTILAQARAAMLVAHVLAPRPGERVLDLCAAPGGKSTHIAALMGGHGEVVAVERDPVRAGHLRETVARMQAHSVKVLEADAEMPMQGPAAGSFDRVLLDAPCSGLGTLQAHPDLRWRMTPERIVELAELQARMLAVAANAVTVGGTLVYSTCTISRTENEQQIEAFLQSRPDFAVAPPATSERYFTTLPSEHRTAGFFIARLRRDA